MKLLAVSRFTQNLAYMASCLLRPLCGCIPGPKLGQISGMRRAKHTHPFYLRTDSSCWRYEAALRGITTTFTNLAAVTAIAGAGFAVDWWWFWLTRTRRTTGPWQSRG